MQVEEQFYAPDIAAKAVIELTNAMGSPASDPYARALLADPRMSCNRGHLASCGVNMRKVKQAKDVMSVGLPTLEAQQKARDFLDKLDHEQQVMNG